MKREHQIDNGVFYYSTNQIGTLDLPLFVAECAYHKYNLGNKQLFMLDKIAPSVDNRMPWRGQLARAYAQYKTAQKRHRAN